MQFTFVIRPEQVDVHASDCPHAADRPFSGYHVEANDVIGAIIADALALWEAGERAGASYAVRLCANQTQSRLVAQGRASA
jgi:hypothetical protein